jgi:hypothetical protein
MRQSANFRMKARGRPHRLQRLCCWTRNLAGREAFAIDDFFANCPSSNPCAWSRRYALERHAHQL